ncbi:hypothetical protein LBYZC6_01940 [Lacrimispora brassicae]
MHKYGAIKMLKIEENTRNQLKLLKNYLVNYIMFLSSKQEGNL